MTVAIEADNFTLNTAARITGIVFNDVENPGTFQGSVVWQIYSAGVPSPGSVIASGEVNNVAHDATGNADLLIEYQNTMAISPVSLAAGNYWLGLHNGPLSLTTYLRCYFEKTGAASVQPSEYYLLSSPNGWTTNAPNGASPNAELVFQLIGIPAAQITAISKGILPPAVTFTTTAGQFYRVEYKNPLSDSTWTTVLGAELIPGDGNPVSVSDPSAGPGTGITRRFYRVLLL